MAQGYRYNPDTVTFDPIKKGDTKGSSVPLRYPKASLDNMDYLRIQIFRYEKARLTNPFGTAVSTGDGLEVTGKNKAGAGIKKLLL